ncbi:unnamed protein product [Didymodactylos carnosus]|uniref:Uncharacterized protein n=1 Tax=Didymodactylos carnosus TaxID=1234261 RepID=A0A814TG54_9BILA|nr:unnamed protein product [Didymodactylos carnosus]CAF3921165.1 unnamed protein product [Didymodactylos carnosus]
MYWGDSAPSIDLCEMHDELSADRDYLVEGDQCVLNINFAEMEKRHRLRIAFEWDDAQDGISSNILPTCRLLSLLTTYVGDTLILEEETRADADIISMQDDNDIMIVENAEDDDVVLTEWKCAGGDDDDIIFLEYKPASKRADI